MCQRLSAICRANCKHGSGDRTPYSDEASLAKMDALLPTSLPMLLRGPYDPRRQVRARPRADRRAHSERVLRNSREIFLTHRPRNLEFLLRQRYDWMNPYVEGKRRVVELGAGAGLSREFDDAS